MLLFFKALCFSIFSLLIPNNGHTKSMIKVLHYNIKELDSVKISEASSSQLLSVKKVLDKYDFDILSLNEIQYDLKDIPNPRFKTNGLNLDKLTHIWKLKNIKSTSFAPANTGKNAKTKPDGTFYISPNSPSARAHADQLNFGTMPGQYSSGVLLKDKKKQEIIISNLKWKDFNPNVDFSKYRTTSGENFPKDMLLFDKNFSDITISIGEKDLHIILLHTVPSYHFGNLKSINDFRNAEQLRFLEWYITGETDYPVKIKDIKHLKENSYFLAMGDLNVGHKDQTSEGSVVLNNIFNKTNPWIPTDKMNFTNESGGYSPKPFRLMLDYIIASKNITPQNGKIIHPDFQRKELGCTNKKHTIPESKIVQKYKDGDKTCFVAVEKEYVDFKNASDHYPIYGEFILK